MMLVTHTIGLASASPFYRLPWRLSSEESTWQCRRHGFDAWVGRSLEEEMAAHSVPAWRIPRTEEPGGLRSVGSHRVRHE